MQCETINSVHQIIISIKIFSFFFEIFIFKICLILFELIFFLFRKNFVNSVPTVTQKQYGVQKLHSVHTQPSLSAQASSGRARVAVSWPLRPCRGPSPRPCRRPGGRVVALCHVRTWLCRGLGRDTAPNLKLPSSHDTKFVSRPGPSVNNRGGKIGPTRWASLVRPKLEPDWAIKLLARKKPGQIWLSPVWPGPVWPSPVWPGPARPARIFFALKRPFSPTGPIFWAVWAVKILARKKRANFGPAQPGPALPIATSSKQAPPVTIQSGVS